MIHLIKSIILLTTIFYIVIISLVPNCLKAEEKVTENKSKKYLSYKQKDIVEYCNKYSLNNPILIKAITIQVLSTKEEQYFDLEIITNPESLQTPKLEYLIDKIKLQSTKIGHEKIYHELPQPIEIKEKSVFINIKNKSKYIEILTDKISNDNICYNKNTEEYYKSQMIKKDSIWYLTDKNFKIELIIDRQNEIQDEYFKKSELSLGFTGGNVIIEDFDNDNYFDLLLNNKIYLNNGLIGFELDTTNYKINTISESKIVLDIDNDGNHDIIHINIKSKELDSIPQSLVTYDFKSNKQNDTLDCESILGIHDFIVTDINNDNYQDIFLLNYNNQLIYLSNKNGKLHQTEINIEKNNIKRIIISDINKDNWKDVIVLNQNNKLNINSVLNKL